LRGTPEAYVQKIKAQHSTNSRYFDINSTKDKSATDPLPQMSRLFGIRHFAGHVTYDSINFLESNSDRLSDDVISIFHKNTCVFGFVTHLFGVELRALYNKETVPRGMTFRIAPTAHIDTQNGYNPVSTLTQDFHTRLDNLLRTLVHARPHFIRCIKV
jgi:dachs protein